MINVRSVAVDPLLAAFPVDAEAAVVKWHVRKLGDWTNSGENPSHGVRTRVLAFI